MRNPQEVADVLALLALGLTHCEISRRTGVPRSTVRDWASGSLPRRSSLSNTACGCSVCGADEHDPGALPQAAYGYLLGLYLGDGTISRAPRDVYRLRIFVDVSHPAIVSECATAMAAVLPHNRVATSVLRWQGHDSCVEISCFSKQWPCLFPQHGPGRKHTRPIVLEPWQEEIVLGDPRSLLRGLIHSDGSRFINPVRHKGKLYRYPRYTFTNASVDIREIFCRYCDVVGIPWRRMTERDISVARREGVALLDEFVGPKR
jgi:hypothetical protein